MAYEKRDLTWSLFKNEKKTRDTHSDYQGWLVVDGKEYWLNGWIKDGAKGKFFSGTLKAKDGTKQDDFGSSAPRKPEMAGGGKAAYDDEIPFSAEFR